MGARRRPLLCRLEQLRHLHPGAMARRRPMGLRSSIFCHFESSSRRRLARQSGRHHSVSPTNASGLRPRLQQKLKDATSALSLFKGRYRSRYRWSPFDSPLDFSANRRIHARILPDSSDGVVLSAQPRVADVPSQWISVLARFVSGEKYGPPRPFGVTLKHGVSCGIGLERSFSVRFLPDSPLDFRSEFECRPLTRG